MDAWEPGTSREREFADDAPPSAAGDSAVFESLEALLETDTGRDGVAARLVTALVGAIVPVAVFWALWYYDVVPGPVALIGAVVLAPSVLILLNARLFGAARRRLAAFEQRFPAGSPERREAEWLLRDMTATSPQATDLCELLVLNPDSDAESDDPEMEAELREILIPLQLAGDSPAQMLLVVVGGLTAAVVCFQLWRNGTLSGLAASGLFVGALLVVMLIFGLWLGQRDSETVRLYRKRFPRPDEHRRRARNTLDRMTAHSRAARDLVRALQKGLY